jgi:hypothetical protein
MSNDSTDSTVVSNDKNVVELYLPYQGKMTELGNKAAQEALENQARLVGNSKN